MRPAAALAAVALAVAGGACGESRSDDPATYVDDRGPGARTAASEPLPGGEYEDPLVEGNQAVQAEEVVRDFQESLATGSGSGACRELSDALARRLAAVAGSCERAVTEAHRRHRRSGDPFQPSKILAVDLRGFDRALVTIEDASRNVLRVPLRLTPAQTWVLTGGVDLGAASGLRDGAGTGS